MIKETMPCPRENTMIMYSGNIPMCNMIKEYLFELGYDEKKETMEFW